MPPKQAQNKLPKRRLNEDLLKEAGMTIFRHAELNWPGETSLELHRISHDWAKLLSKDLLYFRNIIHEGHENLSQLDKNYISNGRKHLLILQSEFPQDARSQTEFVRKWPQAEAAASKRQHDRAERTRNKFQNCHGQPEEQWKIGFRTLLDDIEKPVDPLVVTHPSLPWLQSPEEIKIEGDLEWRSGRKELERNRLRNPDHGAMKLKFPKPDNQISFAVRSVTAESSDRAKARPMTDNHVFRTVRDDPVVKNFSFSTLNAIARDIHDVKSPPFSFFPAWSAARIKKDSKAERQANPVSIGCFPWLICEHKPQPEQEVKVQAENPVYEEDGEHKGEYVYCQAANACAVSLTILARLVFGGSFELVHDDARHHVRPVFAITSIGEKASVWVSYISKVDKGFLQFEMHEIWHGSLYNYVDVFELCIFLDRVHYWAVKALKPWISSCIDHWLYPRLTNSQCNRAQNEPLDADGLAGLRGTYVTNNTINERQSGNEDEETSSTESTCSTPEPTRKSCIDQVIPSEEGNRSTIEQNIEPGNHLHQAQSAAGRNPIPHAAANPISIDQPAISEVQSDQPFTARSFDAGQRLSTNSSPPDFANANVVPGAKILNEQANENPSIFVFGANPSQPLRPRARGSGTGSGSRPSSSWEWPRDTVSPSGSGKKNSLPIQSTSTLKYTSATIPTDNDNSHDINRTRISVETCETSQQAYILYKDDVFQNLLKNCDKLLLDIDQNLHNLHHTELTKSYIEITEKMTPIESIKPHFIGLLGGSGAGKSSLINSLLGFELLAPAGSSGESVTHFATEYRHSPSIEHEFLIEAEYQTEKEVRATIRGLIADYRNFGPIGEKESSGDHESDEGGENEENGEHESDEEGENEENEDYESDRGGENEEHEDLESDERGADEEDDNDEFNRRGVNEENENLEFNRRRSAAKASLKILFQGKLNWKKVCGNPKKYAYQAAVDQLIAWAEQSKIGMQQTLRRTCSTAEDCNKELEELSKSSLWPIINTVRVSCRSAKIDKGIVLLDLPGLRDTNDFRSQMTESQIVRADHIILVSEMQRIKTCSNFEADIKTLKALKRRLAADDTLNNEKRKNAIEVTIVCTKTDSMRYDQEKERFLGNLKAKKKSGILAAVEAIESKIKKATEAEDTAQVNVLKSERQELFIGTQNQLLRTDLRKKRSLRQLATQIFCISNDEYTVCKRDSDCTLCEIPQLRRHCSELIAKEWLQDAEDFVKVMLPGLVAMMRSWYDGRRGAKPITWKRGHEDLKDSLNSARGSLDSAYIDYRLKLERHWTTLTKQKLQGNLEQWDTIALKTVKSWAELRVQSYFACCRRGGTAMRGTDKGQSVERHWNARLLDPVSLHVTAEWDVAEQKSLKILQQFVDKVKRYLSRMEGSIRSSSLEISAVERGNLLKAVLNSKKQTERDLERLVKEMKRQLGYFRGIVFTDSSASSIMRQVMHDTYQDATDTHKGRGLLRRQQQIVESSVRDGVFEAFVEMLDEKMMKVICESVKGAETSIKEVSNILNTLEKGLKTNDQMRTNDGERELFNMLSRHLEHWETEAQKLSDEWRNGFVIVRDATGKAP